MSKTEKVRIDLPGKQSEPAVKMCKARTQKPLVDKFRLVPKYMPFLSQAVEQVAWNCADSMLDLEIQETAGFDAYRWFGTINKRFAESQKSSFVDLEQDSLSLYFEDQDGKDVALVKFRGLKLVKHHCYLSKGLQSPFGIDSPSENLRHSISLRYSDAEMMTIPHIEEDLPLLVSPEKSNEIVDEEWQTVDRF